MPKKVAEMINPWKLFVGAMVPNWLLERHEVSTGAKLCYARLAQFAGRKGYAYPRMATLGEALGLSSRQARTYTKELEDCGLLIIDRPHAQGKANRFRFLSHPWMYAGEVQETTEEIAQGLDELEKSNFSGDLDGPPEGSFRTPLKNPSGPPGRILQDMEENQGRDSQEETQSCAARRHAPQPPLTPQADAELSSRPAACANTAHTLEATIEAAKAKTAAKMRRRADRQLSTSAKKADLKANLNGKVYGKGIRARMAACEELFTGALKERHPDMSFASWGPKERGQCKQLLDKYPFEVVQGALTYAVEGWHAIQKRFKVGPYPSLGWVLSMHTTLVPESQCFAKVKAVLDEMAEWQKNHPTDFPPAELSARYDRIKPELKALGIEE